MLSHEALGMLAGSSILRSRSTSARANTLPLILQEHFSWPAFLCISAWGKTEMPCGCTHDSEQRQSWSKHARNVVPLSNSRLVRHFLSFQNTRRRVLEYGSYTIKSRHGGILQWLTINIDLRDTGRARVGRHEWYQECLFNHPGVKMKTSWANLFRGFRYICIA